MPLATHGVCRVLLSRVCVVLFVCRYVSREYVETVHFQSEPFKQLKAAVGELDWVEPMTLKMYQEKDIGF